MKKTVKVLLSIMLVSIMLFSVCAINVFAANTIISFNKNSVSVGDTVTVTVSLNAGEPIYGVECVVNYNSSLLEYKSGTASGSAGTLKIVEAPSGESKVSYKLTFTAKKAGSCQVSVADANFSGQTEDKGLPGATATLAIQDKTLSANATLKALYLNNGSLSPRFSPSITIYEVKVNNSVTECKISAIPSDSKAKVNVEGSAILEVGKNTRTVIVTAPSGAVKKYTINIIRSAEAETGTQEINPLEVDVEGTKMSLVTDISGVKLFKGFTASQADFGESKVAVAVDSANEYTIYYLKNPVDNSLIPYTYDDKNDVFEKLQYFSQGENSYIFADIPNDKSVPDSFYTTNAQIAGMNVKCYASSGTLSSDFYYIYCFFNGAYGFYRYDSRENVIQRYPDLELSDIQTIQQPEEKKEGYIERFGLLTNNAKIIVIAAAFVILAILALVIILIVKLCKRKNYNDFESDMMSEDDFDDIVIEEFDSSNNNDLIS